MRSCLLVEKRNSACQVCEGKNKRDFYENEQEISSAKSVIHKINIDYIMTCASLFFIQYPIITRLYEMSARRTHTHTQDTHMHITHNHNVNIDASHPINADHIKKTNVKQKQTKNKVTRK